MSEPVRFWKIYDREIVEDSPIDSYWGCGADGLGKNMLGKLLMKLREELKNEQKRVDTKTSE